MYLTSGAGTSYPPSISRNEVVTEHSTTYENHLNGLEEEASSSPLL